MMDVSPDDWAKTPSAIKKVISVLLEENALMKRRQEGEEGQSKFLLKLLQLRAGLKPDNKHAVFVSDEARPREIKLAWALKQLGWKVTLICRNAGDAAGKRFFDEVNIFRDTEEGVFLALLFRPTVYHLFTSWNFDIATVLIKVRPGKVIFDDYDVVTGNIRPSFLHERYPGLEPKEKFCLENADALCCRSLAYQPAKKLGLRYPKKRVMFMEYCWNQLEKEAPEVERLAGPPWHIVYVGGIAIEKLHPPSHRLAYFLELGKYLAEHEIHLHLFPSQWPGRFEEAFSEHLALASKTQFFHIHGKTTSEELVQKISHYHFGLVSIWSRDFEAPDLSYLPSNLHYSFGNKIFDYVDAGIPVINFGHYSVRRFCEHYGIGVYSAYDDIPGRLQKLSMGEYKRLSESAEAARKKLSLAVQGPRLEAFYNSVSCIS